MIHKKPFSASVIAGAVAAWLLLGAALALALEPPTKEQVLRYRQDGTFAARTARAKALGNHRIPQRVRKRIDYRLKSLSLRSRGLTQDEVGRILAPPTGWKGMPTTGTVKVLALLIAFNDYPGQTSPSSMTAKLFGDGEGGFPQESLRNFYTRSSYNQLTIQGNVLGWYTAPYARSSVAETDQGREALIKEALSFYDQQGHDFSQYDNDGDGAIDYFCVFWTGPHGEWASFWWGYYTGFGDSSYTLDGKRLQQYSWQWELYLYPNGTFTPDTIIHETGHALGIPDYYDYDDTVGPRGGVGGLDMMDATSGDHNCFSKFMMDWITPTVVSDPPQTVSLRASGDYPDALLFMNTAVPGEIFDEYFMVQNRLRVGNDTGLFTGSDGLVVWHVDSRLDQWGWNFLYDNSYTEHKLLALEQADGLSEIEAYGGWAEAADYYQAGMTFGPSTVPSTDRYDGTPTAMGIANITGTTTPISLEVYTNDAKPTCEIVNIANGQMVYGTITIEATAGDDNGVSRMELYTNQTLRSTLTAPPFTFSLDTRTLYNGEHTIRAVAYDTIQQTGTSSVTVDVDNIYGPLNLAAQRVVNRSAFLREYINVLTWGDNPKNSEISVYRVYLLIGGERQLLGEVTKSVGLTTNRYLHRKVNPGLTYTYNVVAVGLLSREGDVASVTLK